MILGTFRGVRVTYEPQRRIYAFESENIGTGGMTQAELEGIRNALKREDEATRPPDVLEIVEAALDAATKLTPASP